MKRAALRRRRITTLLLLVLMALAAWAGQLSRPQTEALPSGVERQYFGGSTAQAALETLEVKGRAPKTGYSRTQFGEGWGKFGGCSVREVILARDLTEKKLGDGCKVLSGVLHDPYTGQQVAFQRGPESSKRVQIDHVVALSDAWQKGAQGLGDQQRMSLANDPLNLLAVEGQANQDKGDSDAASWPPPSKVFRCQYVARQIAVKQKYHLWVTDAEKAAMQRVLQSCQAG